MIALGSVNWGSAPTIPISFAYEKQRSGANMQYRVQVTIASVTGDSYFGFPIYLGLSINGSSVATVTLKDATPWRWDSAITYTSAWYTVSNKTSGTTPVAFRLYSGMGSTRDNTYSYTMAVDAAASTISVSNGTLATPLTITVKQYNSGFKHTIAYTCGSVSGLVCDLSSSLSVTWDTSNGNILGLAQQSTHKPTVNVKFTITTYNGASKIDTYSTTVSMAIPESVKPALTLKVEDETGYFSTYGAFVQGWSKLKITATPSVAYGSPIKAYSISADGSTYTYNPVTTGVIKARDSLTVTAKVTDERDHTSEPVNRTVTVLEYSKPSVSVMAYRCNSSGTADPEGAYMKVGFTASISSLNGKNSASYTIDYGSTPITGTGISYTSAPIACDVSKVWSVEVKVSDKLDSTTKSAVIPIAFTLMDFYSTGKGIAFGKVGTRDGFDCAMPAYFTGDTAMPSGVTIGGKTLLNLIYPIGSIYMSVSSTSPATFLGGTWVQIKDTFLLASGTTYTAGATGGEATHTLSISEIPSHMHNRISYVGNDGWTLGDNSSLGTKETDATSTSVSVTGSQNVLMSHWKTGYTGGGIAHNNMPPYLAVYVWKRTA